MVSLISQTEGLTRRSPEGMVSFGDLPKIPWPIKHPGTSEEVSEMRKWALEYGKATRQLSVRAKSTKDQV